MLNKAEQAAHARPIHLYGSLARLAAPTPTRILHRSVPFAAFLAARLALLESANPCQEQARDSKANPGPAARISSLALSLCIK